MLMRPHRKYYLKCFGNCFFGFFLFYWVKTLIDSEKWFSLAALASSLVNPLPELPLWAMVGGKKKKGNSENLWNNERKVLNFTHSASAMVAWYFRTIWNNEHKKKIICLCSAEIYITVSFDRWGRHWRLWRKCWCYLRCWMSEMGNWIFDFW